jgi:DNA polymerase III subunit delta
MRTILEINAEQLEAELEKKLCNAYLLTGDDLWHKQDCLNKIKTAALGFDMAPITQIENDKSWQNFAEQNNNLSLFASKKLYQINLQSSKIATKGKEIILDFIAKQSPDTCLVIVMPKMSAAEKKATWYKKLNEQNLTITIWPLFANKIPAWVNEQLKKINLTADHTAVESLISYHHNNLPALAQTINKLGLLYTDKKLILDDIKPMLYGQDKFTPYDFVETIASGNLAKVLNIIDNFKQELLQINIILYVLTTETEEALFPDKNAYISNMKKNRLQKLQRKLANKDHHKIISALRETEKAVKGLSSKDPWHELANVALAIAKT